MITLGKEYTDKITGFKGVATSRTVYLTGCVHIHLQPKGLTKDGKIKQGEYFDEDRIDPQAKVGSTPGGPSLEGHPHQ
jgi:hypothetical protein